VVDERPGTLAPHDSDGLIGETIPRCADFVGPQARQRDAWCARAVGGFWAGGSEDVEMGRIEGSRPREFLYSFSFFYFLFSLIFKFHLNFELEFKLVSSLFSIYIMTLKVLILETYKLPLYLYSPSFTILYSKLNLCFSPISHSSFFFYIDIFIHVIECTNKNSNMMHIIFFHLS
jgi:hypothetical protein